MKLTEESPTNQISDRNGSPIQDRDWKNWIFGSALVVCAAILAFVFLLRGVPFFSWIANRLPLLLPLFVTLLSISTRATEIRTFNAVLKTSGDIAIGIISFDIWLLSSVLSSSDITRRVLVNTATMIRGEFAIAFLIFGIAAAVGALILNNYSFANNVRGERWSLLTGFVVACLIYVAPFGVLEPVTQSVAATAQPTIVRHYAVAIPFQDPAAVSIAPAVLSQRAFVHLYRDIEAATPDAAKDTAVHRFLNSDESNQIKTKRSTGTGEKVNIVQKDILVAER